ncbi:MAG: hypothetical protein HC787_05560, partial [Nostocaceae cyanobacterium CSU_2_110]|nr:hypothetical protein [Nostocaceae cyanobacterium CSU_2_110]
AECDPGNKMAGQMLGTELTDKLVRALWGGLLILIADNCQLSTVN